MIVLILILLIFFYPKHSATFDMYTEDGLNNRCNCLGLQVKIVGIDSSDYSCYGLPYACKMVKYNYESPVENPVQNAP